MFLLPLLLTKTHTGMYLVILFPLTYNLIHMHLHRHYHPNHTELLCQISGIINNNNNNQSKSNENNNKNEDSDMCQLQNKDKVGRIVMVACGMYLVAGLLFFLTTYIEMDPGIQRRGRDRRRKTEERKGRKERKDKKRGEEDTSKSRGGRDGGKREEEEGKRKRHQSQPTTLTLLNSLSHTGIIVFPLVVGILYTSLQVRKNAVKFQGKSHNYLFNLAVVMLAVGYVCWLLDRHRVVCFPHSPVQLHAVWHIATGVYICLCGVVCDGRVVCGAVCCCFCCHCCGGCIKWQLLTEFFS